MFALYLCLPKKEVSGHIIYSMCANVLKKHYDFIEHVSESGLQLKI